MNKIWVWILAAALVLGLTAIPIFFKMPGYAAQPMMGGAYGWHMPMMYAGNGMWGPGVLWMGLIQLGLLALIGLGIAALVKYLRSAH